MASHLVVRFPWLTMVCAMFPPKPPGNQNSYQFIRRGA
jgi:hypothetical protein